MKKFWKNALNAVVIIFISGGVAAVVTAHVMKTNERKNGVSEKFETTFNQPYQTAMLSNVAAENIDFTYAAEKTVNAVVHIRVVATVQGGGRRQYMNPFEYFFGEGERQQQQQQRPRQRAGSGSGVIISTDGYIITNNHVVDGADSISVTLNDKRIFTGKVIGTDAATDVALIKIEANDLQPIPFGDSDQLKVGEWVLAVGNPFDLTSTVTAGIVSAKGRSEIMGSSARDKVTSYIQTDAAVNMGNSGGALVNTRGELVGINTAIYSQTGDFAGYSFAVPINMASRVVTDLKQYGSFQRAMLGVEIGNPEEVKRDRDTKIKAMEGAYVGGFSAMRSPAKEAGIEIGDVIIAVNGTKVTSPNNLQEQIMRFHIGDKVRIKVDRYGTEKDFTVELRNIQGNTEIIKAVNSAEVLGAVFKPLSDSEKREYGKSYGIQVSNITKGKIRDCGIQNGFVIEIVNDQRIQTPEDFYSIVDKILSGKTEEKGLLVKGFYPNSGATRHYGIDLVD